MQLPYRGPPTRSSLHYVTVRVYVRAETARGRVLSVPVSFYETHDSPACLCTRAPEDTTPCIREPLQLSDPMSASPCLFGRGTTVLPVFDQLERARRLSALRPPRALQIFRAGAG